MDMHVGIGINRIEYAGFPVRNYGGFTTWMMHTPSG